jgi:hypothetical protein
MQGQLSAVVACTRSIDLQSINLTMSWNYSGEVKYFDFFAGFRVYAQNIMKY